MIDNRCGVPEERWIDWHLKRLPADAAEAMARHLSQCPDCRYVCKQWAEWLSPDAVEAQEEWNRGQIHREREDDEGYEAHEADGERRDHAVSGVYPSAHVYRSLRLQMIKRGLRNRLKRRPIWWFGGAAAMLLLLAGFAMRGLLPGPSVADEAAALPPMTYAQLHVPEGAVMMAQPDTKMIAVVPAFLPGLPEAAGKRTVMVWVNGRTKELFVLLEGVLPAGSRDIQAWGTIKQHQTNLGLLEFHQAQGHLYSHDRSLNDMEELAFTIEPKGGSLHPTAPDTARVKLARDP